MTRVLIVEDESIVGLHLKRLIEQLGHVVVGVASNMDDALKLAEASPPDLALVDIRIEGKRDGVTAASALRDAHDCAIVFVTAFADNHTLERTDAVGAAGYLVKPFTEAQLRAVVSTALSGHERMRSIETEGAHLTHALMSIATGIVIVDGNGVVTFMNSPAEDLTGITSARAKGKQLARVLEFTRGIARFDPFLEENIDKIQRLDIASADGKRREVDVSTTRLSPGRDQSALVIALHDISPGSSLQWEKARSNVRHALDVRGSFAGMIGSSEPMIDLYGRIEQLAAVGWTVLIGGETGSGKELVARALHKLSPRRAGPFIAVNCAGLTDTLLGSQLFGHKRGAFTDAVSDHAGVFESASGGTLFLDEIGDVSQVLQRTLLRVLDDRIVVRIGEAIERPVDVRIVTASQRDLPALVEQGAFRADLMYRLRAARIDVPPLRDRGRDLTLLAEHFLQEAAESTGKALVGFSQAALDTLATYSWPGNVRELRGCVSHAALTAGGSEVELDDLPPELLDTRAKAAPPLPDDERARIVEAIRRCEGNRTEAARILGVSRATLYRRMTALDIERPDD